MTQHIVINLPQIEGLVVDKHIKMSDLKGTLELLAKKLFGAEREIRLRPSYFHSQNHPLKLMYLVLNVKVKAVTYVNIQAGLKF